MKEIERYIKEIVSDLPMNDDEKADFEEELYAHFHEHVNDLMVKGNTKDEAILQAMESFGNEKNLNWEMKKAIFPFYKVVRYLWNVVFVTAFLCLVSYSVTEYYHPEFVNALPMDSVIMGFFIVAFIVGAAEVIFEAINDQFKSKWLSNPWLFFLVPSLLFGGIQTFSLVENPEQYQEGFWLDLYAVPIGAFVHLISRQLFTLIFVRNRRDYKENKVV
ncbi:permease prefix domain 1-containing protein [Neobacillus soli]|uniref:permease prefix domain 1-containing protein n=1 Tax=Neobacillus soli TaxID=220688 RepID=UPI000826E440|nr:permease prefix domain 1-containing protein [Neobacillus soli]